MSTHHRLQMLFCLYGLFRGLPSRGFWCILRKERRPFTKTLPPTSSAHSRLLVQGLCAHSHKQPVGAGRTTAFRTITIRIHHHDNDMCTTCRAPRGSHHFFFHLKQKNMVNSVANGSVPSSVPPSCDQDQASPGTRKTISHRISTTFDDTCPQKTPPCCSSNLVNEVPLPPNHG